MSDYTHLDPQHRALAELPDDERIQLIRAERWISHPAAETALAAMEDLLSYPQRNRMPCLLVHGRTGMGKTMILKKFCRDHPRVIDRKLGLAKTPVVIMQLPPGPVEVPFYEELLGALGLPLVERSAASVRAEWLATPFGSLGRGCLSSTKSMRCSSVANASSGSS